MTDHAGHAIVVGTVVKLECVVTAINEVGTHFDGVTVRPSFPAAYDPLTMTIPDINRTSTLAQGSQQPARYNFAGSQLTWVSG